MYLIFLYLIIFLVICATILGIRIFYLVIRKSKQIRQAKRLSAIRTMIVLGSGGHTAEMIRILKHLDFQNYTPRLYVHARTDKFSPQKIRELEGSNSDYYLQEIYRSREVHQSYLTSIWTTLIAIKDAISLYWTQKPELILCNGPGTCVPLCIVAFISKACFFCDTTIIFIESFCRVKTLSLSGKILYYLTDFMIVQWPDLKTSMYKNTYLIK